MKYPKPGKLEIKLFRYLCSQADYTRSTVYKQPNQLYLMDDDQSNYNNYEIVIYFRKSILDHINEFAAKYKIPRKTLIDIANTWFKRYKSILRSEYKEKYLEYTKKTIRIKEYYFDISNYYGNKEYFYWIPSRTIHLLNKKHPDKTIDDFVPRMNRAHLMPTERKLFRWLLRKCDLNESFSAEGCIVVILPKTLDKLILEYKSKSIELSNKLIKKIVAKWSKDEIILDKYKSDRIIIDPGKVDHGFNHDKYLVSMPNDIFKRLI